MHMLYRDTLVFYSLTRTECRVSFGRGRPENWKISRWSDPVPKTPSSSVEAAENPCNTNTSARVRLQHQKVTGKMTVEALWWADLPRRGILYSTAVPERGRGIHLAMTLYLTADYVFKNRNYHIAQLSISISVLVANNRLESRAHEHKDRRLQY